jgi:hypothetical protein
MNKRTVARLCAMSAAIAALACFVACSDDSSSSDVVSCRYYNEDADKTICEEVTSSELEEYGITMSEAKASCKEMDGSVGSGC